MLPENALIIFEDVCACYEPDMQEFLLKNVKKQMS